MAKDIALGRGEELSTWNQVRDQGGQTGPAQEKGQILAWTIAGFFSANSSEITVTWHDLTKIGLEKFMKDTL